MNALTHLLAIFTFCCKKFFDFQMIKIIIIYQQIYCVDFFDLKMHQPVLVLLLKNLM